MKRVCVQELLSDLVDLQHVDLTNFQPDVFSNPSHENEQSSNRQFCDGQFRQKWVVEPPETIGQGFLFLSIRLLRGYPESLAQVDSGSVC